MLLKSLRKEDIQVMQKRQLSVLTFRKPEWILTSILGPLIFIGIEALMQIILQNKPAIILELVGFIFFSYLPCALSLYFYLRSTNSKKNIGANPHLIAWLYGAFDIYNLIVIAFLVLRLSLMALDRIGLLKGVLELVTIVAYIAMSLIVLMFAPNFLSRKIDPKKVRPGLDIELKLALAIPTFLIGLGTILGQILSRLGAFEIGWMLFGGMGLLGSFVLTTIGLMGVYGFIAMAKYGLIKS
jgi:hypothetical protein